MVWKSWLSTWHGDWRPPIQQRKRALGASSTTGAKTQGIRDAVILRPIGHYPSGQPLPVSKTKPNVQTGASQMARMFFLSDRKTWLGTKRIALVAMASLISIPCVTWAQRALDTATNAPDGQG